MLAIAVPTLATVVALGACSRTESSPAAARKPAASATGSEPAPAVVEDDHENLVHVEALLAGENELAIRYQIAPGWHLYWINPGDSGLETHADLQGPPGFSFEPLRYPTPEAFESPGNITSFGYEHETVLFSRFTMPDPPPEQSVITVHASWLACKSSCIRGKAQTSIEIATAQAADDTLLIEHRQKLPRPSAELAAQTRWSTDPAGPVLEVSLEQGELVDFFPLATDPAQLATRELQPKTLSLRYELAADRRPRPAGPQGVIVIRNEDGSHGYFHLEAPWPNA